MMSTRLFFWSLAMFAMGMMLSPLAPYPVPFVEKPVLVIDRVTKKTLHPGDLGYIERNKADRWGAYEDPPPAKCAPEPRRGETSKVTYSVSTQAFVCELGLLLTETADLPDSAIEMIIENGINAFDCRAQFPDTGLAGIAASQRW